MNSVSVAAAQDNPSLHKCPRCLRWTPNDGPQHPCADGTTGIICWRCQDVLCREHPAHEVTKSVIAWRTQNNLPV